MIQVESDLFLPLGLQMDIHPLVPVQMRGMSFGVSGGATTSQHPALGFLWLEVQVKITQGAAELLISRMKSQKTGRGRQVSARSVGGGLNTWMFGHEGLQHCCTSFLHLEWELCLLDPDCPSLKGLPLDIWPHLTPGAWLLETKLMRKNGHAGATPTSQKLA